jgi:hypothetical protein
MVYGDRDDERPEDEHPKDAELREDDVLITIEEAAAFIGGPQNPVDPSTVRRAIKAGLIHEPIHPSPGVSRLVKRRLVDDINRNIRGGK